MKRKLREMESGDRKAEDYSEPPTLQMSFSHLVFSPQ